MHQKKILQLGAAVLVYLLLLNSGAFRALCSREALSFLIFTQTGRTVRPTVQQDETKPLNSTSPTEITQQTEATETAPDAVLSFSSADLETVSVNYNCGYTPDLGELLTQPLELDLTGEEPTVLIVHTHGSECYTGDQAEVESYRTLDNSANMIAIGDELARLLELEGITVLHDRNIYDYPDYNNAYSVTRRSIQSYLEKYPSIQLVLDLHRDAAEVDAGQFATSSTVDGQRSAQLMMVVGTDANGLNHPNWQQNLALALKLSVVLEQENPGITRPVDLRSQRFNMDLSAGSMLIEVGAAGNTLEEALIAANALAEGILKLAQGSV